MIGPERRFLIQKGGQWGLQLHDRVHLRRLPGRTAFELRPLRSINGGRQGRTIPDTLRKIAFESFCESQGVVARPRLLFLGATIPTACPGLGGVEFASHIRYAELGISAVFCGN